MEDCISKEDIEDLKKLFEYYDHDKSGAIRPEQLYELLKSSRFPIEDYEFKSFLVKIDPSGRNAITFDKLLNEIRKRASKGDLKKELMNAFKLFDKKGDGYVLCEEIASAIKGLEMNSKITEDEIWHLVTDADFDGDGKIKYKEFVDMLFELHV